MYEEWFQSMADDEDMPTPNEINVIKDYINNNIPANEAAVRCTSRIALEHNPDPTLLWSLFESMAVELPDTQDKVVELLAAIKRLPDPIRNGQGHRINGQKTFSELAYFAAGFSDYWAGLRDSLRRAPDDPMGSEKWARINAFSARLTTKFVQDFRVKAIETIEDALDEKHLNDGKAREFFLPAAANQFIHGATAIWNIGNDPGAMPRSGQFPSWIIWRTRIGIQSESVVVSVEVKALLKQALEAMDSVAEDPEKRIWSLA